MNSLKVGLATAALAIAFTPSMAQTRSNTTTNEPGASEYAPGQIKNDKEANSAQKYAPGQIKKTTPNVEDKGASTYAPGHQDDKSASPGSSSGSSSGTGGRN
jgi:hypothetical protein